MSTTTRDTITAEIKAIFDALDPARQKELADCAAELIAEQRAAKV